MKEALHYNQVTLIPNKCVVSSRTDCDTTVNFCDYIFDLPVVPANMSTVINEKIARWLAFNKHFYIYHRFSNTRSFISTANFEKWPLVSISIGVKPVDTELIDWISIAKYRVDFITIDIAHGYSDSVATMIKFIKHTLPNTKVIAGNVWGDKKSIEFLQNAGADAIKVGLSCGAGCSTFNETGFGSPMFSAAFEAGVNAKVPVILDGGIRQNGDIAKAIVAFLSNQFQATYGNPFKAGVKQWKEPLNVPMIMAGSIFAACTDAPGEVVYETTTTGDTGTCKVYKKYYGSASAESKQNTGQEVKHIEGKTVMLECNGLNYSQKYNQIKGAIQSQISYAGGIDLTAFKDVEWRTI
jgi:GMP reductase